MSVRPSFAHRLYRLVMRLLARPLLAWLWWRGRREPAYRERLAERLGHVPTAPSLHAGLWLHAASVGEVQAAQPLIEGLLREWPAHALLITTQTPTGAEALRARWGERLTHFYAPLDHPNAVARFLDRVQPRLLVLLEREIWPEWLLQCHQRAIPVALVNARLSEQAYRSYRRLDALVGPRWAALHLITCADAASAQRLRMLGMARERILETGNLKFDVPPAPSDRPPEAWQNGRTLIVAGSTHEADENELLAHWPEQAAAHPDWLLVLVPRHPQRFDAVARELARRRLPFVRRSEGAPVTPATQVLLVDAMGELMHWYRQAVVCFVGGTLGPIGGHNPLEPLALGKPVLFGPHTVNAAALYEEVSQSGAGACVPDGLGFWVRVEDWLAAPATALAPRQQHALALVARHRGAASRTLVALRAVAEGRPVPPQVLGALDPAALATGTWAALTAPMAPPPGTLAPVGVWHQGPHHVWFDTELLDSADALLFDPARHPEGQPLATGSGRAQVLRFSRSGHELVLRHYRRGGMAARFSRDRFAGHEVARSRAMREFALLRLMRSWKLPVPRPVAAHCRLHGLMHEADLVIELVPNSANLVQHLRQGRPPARAWAALGRAIRQIHDHQVFHADLNAHNLLLDAQGRAWILDFDKGERRSGESWKAANLARLLRSLRKEAGRQPSFHWHEDDWALLLAAYGAPGR